MNIPAICILCVCALMEVRVCQFSLSGAAADGELPSFVFLFPEVLAVLGAVGSA